MGGDISIQVMLAQAVLVENNKLHILGGGCDSFKVGQAQAVAVLATVPWNQANRRFHWELALLDADGRNVVSKMGGVLRDVRISDQFSVSPVTDVPPGSPIKLAFEVSIGPSPLPAGRYVWRFSLDGVEKEEWSLPFSFTNQEIDR